MFEIKDNYLAAGDALTQLLEPLVMSQKLKKVYQANELSEVDERSQIHPRGPCAVYGRYAGGYRARRQHQTKLSRLGLWYWLAVYLSTKAKQVSY